MHLSCSRPAALAAVLLVGVTGIAPAAPLPEKPKVESPVEKVRKALDQVLDLDLAAQPLSAALDQLREETKVNFVIDQVTVAQLGIDPMSAPAVTAKLTRVKARTALRNVLDQLNLTFVIVGDAVHVTSEEGAVQRQLRQRVSLDLSGVTVQAALKQLAKETGVNLLVDAKSAKEAQTAVTLQLDEVPLETAVRLLAESAGLKAARVGNVLVVTSKAHAAELRAEPDLLPRSAAPLDGAVVPGGAGLGAVIGGAAGALFGPAVPEPMKPEKAVKPDEKR